jgi:hypothetical protein
MPTGPVRPLPLSRAIAIGGVLVGTFDAVDAIVFFGLRSGAPPGRIFQGIAAGLLGRERSLAGGLPTVLLGVLCHYTIATLIVTVYAAASRLIAVLRRHPFACGPIYGVAVFFVMNLIVIPLSAIGGPVRFNGPGLANGLLIHVFGIGIPAAFMASRAAPRG